MVPPGSANLTIQAIGNGQRATALPRRVVTLETIAEKNIAQTPSLQQAVISNNDSLSQVVIPNNELRITNNDFSSISDDEPLELPDLTPEQLSFLTSERYREASSMIKREFGMEDDDLSFLAEMEHAVLGGVINLEQFIVALRGEFPHLNDAEKSRLIGILLAYRFEPFADQLRPTPQEAARNQGIKLAVAPYYRIYNKPLTFRGAAHEIARMAGVDLMGQAQERLRDAIISRMKGIRTDGQIEELFMRPPEQAGLGLSEDKARLTREAVVEMIGRARLLNEDEYAKWLNDQIHKKKAQAEQLPPLSTTPVTPLQDDEEKEIADIASRMPAARKIEEETVLTRSVASIIAGLSWHPVDEYLLRRLENTISTRLRDVRSRNEVFIKLMRDDKVGGLGLERKQAEGVSEEIEKGYQTYRSAVADEEKKKLNSQLIEQEQKVEERKRRDAEEHAKWYEEKVRAKQDPAKNGLELLKVIARGQTTPIHPLDAKEEAKERASFGTLVDATKTGAPPEAAAAFRQLATAFKDGKGSVKKTAPQPAVSNSASEKPPVQAAPSVRVSVETARLAKETAGSMKPKMQDVTRPARQPGSSMALAGPMQEIGQMTLEHFRRLASDPKAAAKRVIALTDVLAHESYERRIAATEAWRSSPLQRMYLELVAAAFMKKKSVTDIANEKRASGQAAPTPEEISAIIDLNRALSL